MKISKLLIIIIVAVLSTFLFSTVTLAGGWHKIGTKEGNTTNEFAPDKGLWSSSSSGIRDRVPHLDLSTSSNKCRTCHAVHNSDNVAKGLGSDLNADEDDTDANETGTGQSFKLLRNESRSTECFFCHGDVGALTEYKKKPYAPLRSSGLPGGLIIPPKGEHTLGATTIPDSTVSQSFLSSDGLRCGVCHSVHGGSTLNIVYWPDGSLMTKSQSSLVTRILRRDPAQNGYDGDGIPGNDPPGANGAAGGVKNVQYQGPIDPGTGESTNKPVYTFQRPDEYTPGEKLDEQFGDDQLLAGFCGDCHNKNVNWDRGGFGYEGQGAPPGNEGERPNKYGHPLGDTDELIDVYGKLKTVADKGWDGYLTCDNCHLSRNSSSSKFPHQSIGHKLLADSYTDTSTYLDNGGSGGYTGDPERPLPALQARVCMVCHGAYVGKPDDPNSF